MSKKAFFFDIDGTILYEEDNKVIVPESTIKGIKLLQEKGHKIFLATGRPLIFIPDEFINYNHDGIVCSNGAVVYNNKKELVYEKVIPNTFIEKFINFCDENSYTYMIEGDKAYIKSKKDEKFKRFFSHITLPENTIKEGYDFNNSKAYNLIIIGNDLDKDIISNFLGEEFYIATQNFSDFYDIFYKDNSKADGIEKMIKHYKLEGYQVYAFGDGGNDIQMIERADFGIAMGNAKEILKEKADYVTTDIKNNGIYNALKYYKLI